MIPEAFSFAVKLLQSCFEGVEVTDSSASVKYADDQEKEPPAVVTADALHDHLADLGYERKTGI